MRLKGIFAERPAFFQLLTLLMFILAGSILSSLIAMGGFYAVYGFSANLMNYPNMVRILQLASAIGTFLLPAIGVAWMCSTDPEEYLSTKKIPDGNILMLLLFGILLLSPVISLTGLLNKQLELPAFMEPIERWMKTQEEIAQQFTDIILAGDGIFNLLFKLLVIAVAAAVAEEFLFRGALQRIISKWTSNHHLVIWLAAFLFSAFHMQFFGFLPRLLIGAYLGYLLYWSQSIWVPVFAHFFNNAIAVIGMSDSRLKDNEFITGEISNAHLLPFTAIALVCMIIFFLLNSYLRKQFDHR